MSFFFLFFDHRPLEEAVSKWSYRLHATDSGGDVAVESLEVIVQQHKGIRRANHEISIGVKLVEKYKYNIDWHMRLIKGIVKTLGDGSTENIVVREIRTSTQDRNSAVFVFTNETLPTTECPEKEMNEILAKLDLKTLSRLVGPDISITSLSGQLINTCKKIIEPAKPIPSVNQPIINSYPILRNPIDRINATVGHLLVFKVPSDTFFDSEDNIFLKQSVRTINDTEIPTKHWLQFDPRNTEFFGIPKSSDIGSLQYVLVR